MTPLGEDCLSKDRSISSSWYRLIIHPSCSWRYLGRQGGGGRRLMKLHRYRGNFWPPITVSSLNGVYEGTLHGQSSSLERSLVIAGGVFFSLLFLFNFPAVETFRIALGVECMFLWRSIRLIADSHGRSYQWGFAFLRAGSSMIASPNAPFRYSSPLAPLITMWRLWLADAMLNRRSSTFNGSCGSIPLEWCSLSTCQCIELSTNEHFR